MDIAAEPPPSTSMAESGPVSSRHPEAAWMVAGALLTIAGQTILTRTPIGHPQMGPRQAVAGVLLIIGAVAFGWATRMFGAEGERPADTPTAQNSPSAGTKWSLIALAVFIAATAINVFVLFGENLMVRLLWLASIAVLWLDPLLRTRWARPRVSAPQGLYLLGLLGLLAVALITRTYHLTTLPYDVDQDFAAEGLQARLIATGTEPNIFKFGDRQVPMFTYLPAAMTMKVFGTGLAGLNASGVIEGLLIILGVYLLGRELFSARVGLLAAAFLVVSLAHLSASRQSGYIDPVFYLTFASYFMINGLRTNRDGAVVAAGVMTALALQSYWSGRLVVPLFGTVFVGLLIWRRAWLSQHRGQLALFLVAVLVTLGPMLVVLGRQPLRDAAHPQAVSIFSPDVVQHMQQSYQVDTPAKAVLEQARRAALTFHYYPDTGVQFGLRRLLLDPGIAFFFTLGLGMALFGLRRIGPAYLLTWILLGLVFGVFLAANPPQLGRTMILMPPAAILAALPMDAIYRLLRSALQRVSPATGLFATGVLMLFFANIGVQNWNTYVELRGTYAAPRTFVGRYLAEQPRSTRAFLVTTLGGWSERNEEFRFLAPGILVGTLTPEQLATGIPSGGDPRLLILMWDQADLAQALPTRIPGGTLEPVQGSSPGSVAFYVYRLP